ncbi:hypothetical protein D3C87_1097720 [compost metagenome]
MAAPELTSIRLPLPMRTSPLARNETLPPFMYGKPAAASGSRSTLLSKPLVSRLTPSASTSLPTDPPGMTAVSTMPSAPIWFSTLPAAMLPPWLRRLALMATSLPNKVMLPPSATCSALSTVTAPLAAMRMAPSCWLFSKPVSSSSLPWRSASSMPVTSRPAAMPSCTRVRRTSSMTADKACCSTPVRLSNLG